MPGAMVLTGTVPMSRDGTRRDGPCWPPAAGLGVTAAGRLRSLATMPTAPAARPDPLQPLLDEALALAAAYDRASLAQPGLAARLTPLAADHRAHAAELARVIGATVPSGRTARRRRRRRRPPTHRGLLRAAEQAAQKTAAAACRQAPAGRAALLGSIAACRATHAEALR